MGEGCGKYADLEVVILLANFQLSRASDGTNRQ